MHALLGALARGLVTPNDSNIAEADLDTDRRVTENNLTSSSRA